MSKSIYYLRFKHSCETPVKILVGFERFERVYRSASWLVAYPLAKIKLRSIADAKFSHVDDVVNKKGAFKAPFSFRQIIIFVVHTYYKYDLENPEVMDLNKRSKLAFSIAPHPKFPIFWKVY